MYDPLAHGACVLSLGMVGFRAADPHYRSEDDSFLSSNFIKVLTLAPENINCDEQVEARAVYDNIYKITSAPVQWHSSAWCLWQD